MDLDIFSRQIDTMTDQLRGWARLGTEGACDPALAFDQFSSALGDSMEELRVAEEELRRQSDELMEWREAVEAERHRYRHLFEFVPDPYLVTDPCGLIREANQSAVEFFGVSAHFLRGKPLANFLPMEDRSAFRGGMHRLLLGGRRSEWPARFQPRTGGTVAATITAEAVRDREGQPVGIRWMIRETSAPARQSVVEPGSEGLHDLLDGAGVIVWESDARTGLLRWISPGIEGLLGYPLRRWTEEPGFWASIVHPEDRSLVEIRRRPGFPSGRDRGLEYRMVGMDGRVLWFRETLAHVPVGNDGPAVVRGGLWEITRRKKIERQLDTDRRHLSERLSDITYLYGIEGQLLQTLDLGEVLEEVLAAFASFHGADLGAIRMLHPGHGELETVVSLGLSPEYLERFGRVPVGVGACGLAVERLGPVVIEDIEADPAAQPWLEAARLGGYRACFSLPLLARGEELLGTVALFFAEPHRPTPRQIQLAEQYILRASDAIDNARRHRRACESDRRKQEFLTTLAHELRNPIAAIRDWVQLLDADHDSDSASDSALAREVIARQAGVMARLVDDLLDAARTSLGSLTIRKVPVELGALADQAAADLLPLIGARGQQLEVTLPVRPLWIDADPTRLGQVLANLLTNASKFTDPGGRIDLIVSSDAADGLAVLRVRDTGIGLASEELAEVFEPFVRLLPARDRGGLGIGLTLVRSLIELHGGTVTARSPGPGRGSEFAIRLPISRQSSADPGDTA